MRAWLRDWAYTAHHWLWGREGIMAATSWGGVVHCGDRPAPDSGAYGSWYCQRRRWHGGWCRYRNYVWPKGSPWGSIAYDPLPVRQHPARWPRWLPGRLGAALHMR